MNWNVLVLRGVEFTRLPNLGKELCFGMSFVKTHTKSSSFDSAHKPSVVR